MVRKREGRNRKRKSVLSSLAITLSGFSTFSVSVWNLDENRKLKALKGRNLLESGIDLRYIQKVLGYKSSLDSLLTGDGS